MILSFEKERLTATDETGAVMGHVSFPGIRTGLVRIDQVSVRPAFRGQGVEDALLEAALNHLEQLGQKAALTCPQAQRYVKANGTWSRILPEKIHFETH